MDIDSVKAALAAFIDWRTQRLDYAGLQAATVQSQSLVDNSVDVVFEDARYPALTGVRLLAPAPGCKVKVATGARVMVGWVGCNPDLPVAVGWDTGSTTELDLTATSVVLNGGTLGVARITDTVTGTAGPYPVSASITTGNATVKA